MTFQQLIYICAALVYAGVSLGYVHERLKRRHESPVLDVVTFPCVVIWALPFLVYWLVKRAVEKVVHRPESERLQTFLVRLWGLLHALLVLGGWAAFAVHQYLAERPLLPAFLLLGVLLPLEVFLAVPPGAWNLGIDLDER